MFLSHMVEIDRDFAIVAFARDGRDLPLAKTVVTNAYPHGQAVGVAGRACR